MRFTQARKEYLQIDLEFVENWNGNSCKQVKKYINLHCGKEASFDRKGSIKSSNQVETFPIALDHMLN